MFAVMARKKIGVFIGLTLVSFWAWSQKTQTTIAFGSCSDQEKPQELWQDIVKQKPELWIWGGDNIYADTGDTLKLKEMYGKQKWDPDYQAL